MYLKSIFSTLLTVMVLHGICHCSISTDSVSPTATITYQQLPVLAAQEVRVRSSPLMLLVGSNSFPVCADIVMATDGNATGVTSMSPCCCYGDIYGVVVENLSPWLLTTRPPEIINCRHAAETGTLTQPDVINQSLVYRNFSEEQFFVDSICFKISAQTVGNGSIRIVVGKPNLANDSHLVSGDVIAVVTVSAMRRKRAADVVFAWAIAVMALLNAYSLGCATRCNDVTSCDETYRKPVAILVTSLCHFVILPAVGDCFCL